MTYDFRREASDAKKALKDLYLWLRGKYDQGYGNRMSPQLEAGLRALGVEPGDELPRRPSGAVPRALYDLVVMAGEHHVYESDREVLLEAANKALGGNGHELPGEAAPKSSFTRNSKCPKCGNPGPHEDNGKKGRDQVFYCDECGKAFGGTMMNLSAAGRPVATSDGEIMLDLYDLTGDHEPVSLAQFIADNSAPDVAPLDLQDIAALRRLRVGQHVYLGIGGGGVKIKRIG
jgi:hypothetical protein